MIAIVFLGAGTAVTAGAPGTLSDKFNECRSADAPTTAAANDVFGRLADLSGSNRYQYWQSAVRGFQTDRLKGIGPGGFKLWWARDGEIVEFVRRSAAPPVPARPDDAPRAHVSPGYSASRRREAQPTTASAVLTAEP